MSQVLFVAATGVIADIIPDKLHPGNQIVESENWSGPVGNPFKCIDVEQDEATVKQRIATQLGIESCKIANAVQIDTSLLPILTQNQLATSTRVLASTDQVLATVSLVEGVTLEDLNGS